MFCFGTHDALSLINRSNDSFRQLRFSNRLCVILLRYYIIEGCKVIAKTKDFYVRLFNAKSDENKSNVSKCR